MAITMAAPTTALQQFQSITDFLRDLQKSREAATQAAYQQAHAIRAASMATVPSAISSGFQTGFGIGQIKKAEREETDQKAALAEYLQGGQQPGAAVGAPGFSPTGYTEGGGTVDYTRLPMSTLQRMAANRMDEESALRGQITADAYAANLSVPEYQEARQNQRQIAGLVRQAYDQYEKQRDEKIASFSGLVDLGIVPEPIQRQWEQVRTAASQLQFDPDVGGQYLPEEKAKLLDELKGRQYELALAGERYQPPRTSWDAGEGRTHWTLPNGGVVVQGPKGQMELWSPKDLGLDILSENRRKMPTRTRSEAPEDWNRYDQYLQDDLNASLKKGPDNRWKRKTVDAQGNIEWIDDEPDAAKNTRMVTPEQLEKSAVNIIKIATENRGVDTTLTVPSFAEALDQARSAWKDQGFELPAEKPAPTTQPTSQPTTKPILTPEDTPEVTQARQTITGLMTKYPDGVVTDPEDFKRWHSARAALLMAQVKQVTVK